MFGIIATIIAVKKRHYTFAWVVGIWTGIAFVLALSGAASIAFAPGVLFLLIAVGMKKIPETSASNTTFQTKQTTGNTHTDASYISIQPKDITESSGYPLTQDNRSFTVDRTPFTTAICFCRYCGSKLERGAKYCSNCGARIE